MSSAAIAFERVTVRYESNGAATIDDLSLSVGEGERVALVGLNGSGKTTLLMAAVGLISHEGEIRVCGVPVCRRNLQKVRDKVGFLFNVPEDQLLFPRVIDDAAFALQRKGIALPVARDRAMLVLSALGVGHLAESPVHHLSHGQKQRVALAGALVSEPPLMLLDEPSAALDPRAKRELATLLGGLGAAMLVATHDLEFALRFCTRFVAIQQGRVVFDGTDSAEAMQRCERQYEAGTG